MEIALGRPSTEGDVGHTQDELANGGRVGTGNLAERG